MFWWLRFLRSSILVSVDDYSRGISVRTQGIKNDKITNRIYLDTTAASISNSCQALLSFAWVGAGLEGSTGAGAGLDILRCYFWAKWVNGKGSNFNIARSWMNEQFPIIRQIRYGAKRITQSRLARGGVLVIANELGGWNDLLPLTAGSLRSFMKSSLAVGI